MNRDYLDSLNYIRKSERDDYSKGVEREYDVYLTGDIVWAKFRPNMTYKVRNVDNQFSKYVLDFEKSSVYFVPPKVDKNDENENITLNNLYISNLDGEVILDYNLCGTGKVSVDDYLAVNVKCDSLIVKNCNVTNNYNLFMGIQALDMNFINCNIECYVKGICLDDINSIILDNSSLECIGSSFVNFNKIIVDSGSLIFTSKKDVNLYAKNITLNSGVLGFKSPNNSRVIFKYLEAVDSKINSSSSGISVHGIKKTSLVNSIIGNNAYNNDVTISDIDRDKLSIIYNNVSERDSMSYTGFIERYRGEVRSLYLGGKISSFEYNKILDDLDKFLSINTKK